MIRDTYVRRVHKLATRDFQLEIDKSVDNGCHSKFSQSKHNGESYMIFRVEALSFLVLGKTGRREGKGAQMPPLF